MHCPINEHCGPCCSLLWSLNLQATLRSLARSHRQDRRPRRTRALARTITPERHGAGAGAAAGAGNHTPDETHHTPARRRRARSPSRLGQVTYSAPAILVAISMDAVSYLPADLLSLRSTMAEPMKLYLLGVHRLQVETRSSTEHALRNLVSHEQPQWNLHLEAMVCKKHEPRSLAAHIQGRAEWGALGGHFVTASAGYNAGSASSGHDWGDAPPPAPHQATQEVSSNWCSTPWPHQQALNFHPP